MGTILIPTVYVFILFRCAVLDAKRGLNKYRIISFSTNDAISGFRCEPNIRSVAVMKISLAKKKKKKWKNRIAVAWKRTVVRCETDRVQVEGNGGRVVGPVYDVWSRQVGDTSGNRVVYFYATVTW